MAQKGSIPKSRKSSLWLIFLTSCFLDFSTSAVTVYAVKTPTLLFNQVINAILAWCFIWRTTPIKLKDISSVNGANCVNPGSYPSVINGSTYFTHSSTCVYLFLLLKILNLHCLNIFKEIKNNWYSYTVIFLHHLSLIVLRS